MLWQELQWRVLPVVLCLVLLQSLVVCWSVREIHERVVLASPWIPVRAQLDAEPCIEPALCFYMIKSYELMLFEG